MAKFIFQMHDLKQIQLNKALYYDLRERPGYPTMDLDQTRHIKTQYDFVWNKDYSLTKTFFQ